MEGLVVISGCSGGGKSTVLAELARRGFAVVPEPGRRVVEEELASGGRALPWIDLEAFARRALAIAVADRAAAAAWRRPVFFDRSAIDPAAALEHAAANGALDPFRSGHRYHEAVFFTPPWPEIYASDDARQHGFDEAEAEYARLLRAYPDLGYQVCLLPKLTVAERADAILAALGFTVSG